MVRPKPLLSVLVIGDVSDEQCHSIDKKYVGDNWREPFIRLNHDHARQIATHYSNTRLLEVEVGDIQDNYYRDLNLLRSMVLAMTGARIQHMHFMVMMDATALQILNDEIKIPEVGPISIFREWAAAEYVLNEDGVLTKTL